MADSAFDPTSVDLTTADPREVVCFLKAGENDYDGRLGLRVSALFVILVTSSCAAFFPVVAARVRRLRVPLYAYLFARYFGAGVILATAFIHLLDPAYEEIGPASCVGMTRGWAEYTWPPCLALVMVVFTFLLDFAAEWFVEKKYGLAHSDGPGGDRIEATIAVGADAAGAAALPDDARRPSHAYLHTADQDKNGPAPPAGAGMDDLEKVDPEVEVRNDRAFREQFAAFLVLEFGVIFHSVIIGLNLGVVGDEFSTLYPVIVFHQAFEGLGIGARLSAIPFPAARSGPLLRLLPWLLCAAYGLTTPISIAIGLGGRTTYNGSSFTANVVSGILDSISAGILIYTALVELLARDFLFNPERSRDGRRVSFMLVCMLLGTGIMALLGKWA